MILLTLLRYLWILISALIYNVTQVWIIRWLAANFIDNYHVMILKLTSLHS
jgi:hypothetical protein